MRVLQLADRLPDAAALEQRTGRIRDLGEATAFCAVTLLLVAVAVYMPPTEQHINFNGTIETTAAIARLMADHGLTKEPRSCFNVGATQLGMAVTAFQLLIFVTGASALARKRWKVLGLMVAMTVALQTGGPHLPSKRCAHGALEGHVLDHAGGPAITLIGTTRQVAPLYLRPESLPGRERPGAHYVLAQVAYLEGDPERVALHLAGMGRAYPQSSSATRDRIQTMNEFVFMRGHPPPGPPSRAGIPFFSHAIITFPLAVLAVALLAVAFLLNRTGGIMTRRLGRIGKMRLVPETAHG